MTGSSAHNDVWASEPGGRSGGRRAGRQGRPRRGRFSGRRRSWTAVVGYAGLAVLAMGLAATAFVLVAPPLDAVRHRLIHEVEARTGRTLSIAGPMSVSLYPRVVVSLAGITMPPPAGMEGAPTVTVPALDAEMSLWSLISRRPQLDRLTLHRPTIDLAVDAQGRPSWKLVSTAAAPRPAATAGKVPAEDDNAAAPPPPRPVAKTRSRRPIAVRIVNGTLRYRDARSGARYEIGGLDLRLKATGQASEFNGAFLWQGTPFRLTGSVSLPNGRTDGPAQVVLRLAGAPLEATYRGTLSLQGLLSAQGTVALARLVYKDLNIGPATLDVAVDGDIAKVSLRDTALYGGRGQGSLTLDTSGSVPAVATSLKLTGVSVLPLLKAVAGVAWLDGRGAVTLALKAQGASEKQLLETVQGQVKVDIAEGAVMGFDIERTMRDLQHGRLGDLAPQREDRTSFSALTGTFDIADGIAENSDLRLSSAHVQLKGEGRIELIPRRIDYTLHTEIEGGAADDDAVVRIGTLKLPVRITGPLDRPKFTIKGQEGLTDAIERVGRNLRSPEVQDAIKGLLGGDGDKQADPRDLIEKLFK